MLSIVEFSRKSPVVRSSFVRAAIVGVFATFIAVVSVATFAGASGTWSDAIPVPGLVSLNIGNGATVSSVSCSSDGNCALGGSYTDGSGYQGFVASQTNGTWNPAIVVPGLTALNTGNNAQLNSVSCSSDGNCAIGGYYLNGAGNQGFVASQTKGTWNSAIPVLGLAALNTGDDAAVESVSCSSDGNCALGGYYTDGSGYQGFVATQTNGTWNAAIAVPGLATLNTGNDAIVDSVSCSSDGNCAIGGFYTNGSGYQGFVATQTNGTWNAAIAVPGLATLNTGNFAAVESVSCSSDGNCAIGGYYRNGSGSQGFVATRTNGAWNAAIAVPGLAALNTNGIASVPSVSCSSDGACAIGGRYVGGSGAQGFVATRTNGTWNSAFPVPGLAALNIGNNAAVRSVSCSSDGNCALGGYYTNGSGYQGFVATQTNGTWNSAIPVPGLAALNIGNNAFVNSVSCSSDGNCAIGGRYIDGSGAQGFVADLVTPHPPSSTTTSTTSAGDPVVPAFTG